MSFKAKLFIGDYNWDIINAQFLYYQITDRHGKPKSFPGGGLIEIKVQADRNHDVLMKWMLSHDKMIDGYLRYYKRNDSSKEFDFEFWDAYCVGYSDNFSINNNEGLTTTIKISPGIQRVKGVVFEKIWKITDLTPKKDKAPALEKQSFDEFYIVDANNNRIEEIDKEQKIELVIKTSGKIGKEISIDLSNADYDFKYKGELLKNDTIQNLTINKNIERIQLEVVKQN